MVKVQFSLIRIFAFLDVVNLTFHMVFTAAEVDYRISIVVDVQICFVSYFSGKSNLKKNFYFDRYLEDFSFVPFPFKDTI